MSYPSFEDEMGCNAPWYLLPLVLLFWLAAFAVAALYRLAELAVDFLGALTIGPPRGRG